MFTRRFTEEQRRAIYELKQEGKSGSEVSKLCARGVKGLEPFELTRDSANRIGREEGGRQLSPLAQGDLGEAVITLTRRLIQIVERWIAKSQRRDVSPMEFRRMANTLTTLHAIASKQPGKPATNGNGKLEPGFLERLAERA
jgi:hypothetical protein